MGIGGCMVSISEGSAIESENDASQQVTPKGKRAAEAEEVQRMVRRILNKLLHAPSHTLRKFSGRDDQPLLLEFLHELHDLSTAPAAAEPIRKQHLSLVKG
jgi:glutamyl-tRNA reductase